MSRLNLTNWGSRRHFGKVGAWTMMVAPRSWERGMGSVPALVPEFTWLQTLRATADEDVAWAAYRARFDARLAAMLERGPGVREGVPGGLRPGALLTKAGDVLAPVVDDATVCCCCAVGARCHRLLVAPWLVRAGWDVMLDGEPYKVAA